MTPSSSRNRWLATGAALVLACGVGFGLARLTGKPGETAPEAPAAPATAARSTLTIPAANLALMQIAVEPVRLGAFAADIQAPATVASSPQGQAVLTAQAAGTVIRIAKTLGDQVRAGEVLAQVASREAAGMAADRTVADSKAALARQVLARERRLNEQGVTPRQDLERAQAELTAAEAEARRARTAAQTARMSGDGRSVSVVSPISGRITAQAAALGAYVQPETELFRIADPRFIQIEAAVPAADAARVRAGDPARVTTAAGVALTAVVRSVTPTLDAQTRAATVILTVTGADGAVTPGELLQAQISPRSAAPTGVIIPDEAVQTVDGREVVFVRTPTGFRVQTVTVGARAGGRASIAAGLASGQAIATRNAFLLKAELTKGADEE